MSRWVKGSVALAVGIATVITPFAAGDDGPVTPATVALTRLDADARPEGTTRGPADETGRLSWLGTRRGAVVRNPDVTPATSPDAAVRAHLRRYGAAFGLPRGDSELVIVSRHQAAGSTVSRLRQTVDGVPVIASGVSVETAPDGQLRSMLVDVSQASSVRAAAFGEARAEGVARAYVRDRHAGRSARLVVDRGGRAIYDPAVIGAEPTAGRHSVWSFTVATGPGLARAVLVDDQSGAIVSDIDRSEAANRVICDNANVLQSWTTSCDAGFARTEGGSPSGITDVDRAYDQLGAASAFYSSIAGIDLTTILGRDLAGGRSLSATVRYCEPGSSCPMSNAYWFKGQMYTGSGFAVDDIVGHELTHGVIEKYADLFYWGQSGAINEGLADVMGEQIDRALASPGEPADTWLLGEETPGGAARSLANPAAAPYYQPDRTGSPRYAGGASDNGGVHTNSGVLLKTFHLASQGGTFNGRTVTGIDGGDPATTKSAHLWWQAMQRLVPGSDFADLGRVLDQACTALQGTHGFSAADCAQVHEAGVATELATSPVNAVQPADAPRECPAGRVLRVLVSSEADPAAFRPSASGSGWTRTVDPAWGPNAHSGHDAWQNAGRTVASADALVAAAPVVLPAGQPAYLRFQQWRFLDAEPGWIYDAGTVELKDSLYGPLLGESLPASSWVNGPAHVISSGQGNPFEGRKGFGADSHGWTASRLDLSFAAGRSITPQLSLSTDRSYAFLPWFLDDIEVYTCDPAPSPSPSVSTSASPTVSATPTATTSPTTTASSSPTATATPSSSSTPTAPSPTVSVTPTVSSSPTTSTSPTATPAPTTSSAPVAPGAPASVALQPAAAALAVALSWGAPASKGSGVTGYRVTRSDGAAWTYPTAGAVVHAVPGNTTLTYAIRTLGRSGTASTAVKRVVSARILSLGALPSSVRAGTTLTLSGVLKRLPDRTVAGGQVVTVRYLRSGSTTWRTLTTSSGAAVKATSTSTGKVVVRVPALRGTVTYRLFGSGFRATSRSWLRVWSPARKVVAR